MLDFVTSDPLGTPSRMRVLSVSGGGLLGVIPAAILMHYETLGRRAYGSGYRLSDSFDLVGGSSTGAVIATGVALGLGAAEIADFYLRDVPKGFKRRRRAVPLLHDLFDGDLMQQFFLKRTGGRCLDRDVLQCHLAITTKDLVNARPMVFSTLPGSSAEEDMTDVVHRRDALPLDLLLRASTAAPGLFPPVELPLLDGEKRLAADGGLGPFNDPGLLLSRLAWAAGALQVELTGLGTGSTRPKYRASRWTKGPSAIRALRALMGLIKDGEAQTRQMLETVAASPSEALSYRNIDMGLDRETFTALGLDVSDQELAAMRNITKFAGKVQLFEAAMKFAEMKISDPLPLCIEKTFAGSV